MAAVVSTPPTLAIALDAAEPTLIRRLLDAGEMPVLARLAVRGTWAHVTSGAHISSGCVWPTFASASGPLEHATNYLWRWDPSRMRLVREYGDAIVPWWRTQAQRGHRVLTLDVPYLPFANVEGCVEISEWGSHDLRRGSVHTRPTSLRAKIARDTGAHPFQHEPAPSHDDPSARYLAAASARACAGARLRGELAARLMGELTPDLALIVFSEIHHASHLLWQTIAPDDVLFGDRRRDGLDDRALINLFCAVDDALGAILESTRPDTRVVVFSLHGMRSASGIPTLLHPLLVHLGYAAVPRAGRMSPRDTGRAALAAAKTRAPGRARLAWRRSAPAALLNAVANPTAMRTYDWDRTRAFPLPHDQHGWLRVNLAGREAHGIVPAAHYAGLCDELSAALLAARTQDGRPLVKRVWRTASENGDRPPATFPDLVVDWDDAAHDNPVRVAGSDIVASADALRLTGKHTYDGFLLTGGAAPPGKTVAGHELHRLIAAGP